MAFRVEDLLGEKVRVEFDKAAEELESRLRMIRELDPSPGLRMMWEMDVARLSGVCSALQWVLEQEGVD
jgi:hypothetical protein